MLAQFSITPLGVGEKLAGQVAGILDIIDRSGLEYRFSAMSTIVEGDWDEIMGLIRLCRDHLRREADRVLINIVIDDRKGAAGRLDGKVRDVETVLGRKLKQ